jgi:hypothetical protein
MKSELGWRCVAGFFLLVPGLILIGCAYNQVLLTGGKAYSIERVHSSPVYVSWVHAKEENNEMIVTGLLRSHFYYTQGTGHVDVAIIGPGSELLLQTSADYDPKTFQRFRGKESVFVTRIPFVPPDGSRIRVTLHYYPTLE